jgi:peptide/nickel transport system permease protein
VGTRQYVIGKIVQALLTLVVVMAFNFFLFRVWSPGDPVTFLTRGQGAQISPDERAALIQEYGLDKSVWGQFTEYIKDTFTGKLGISSFYQDEPVLAVFLRFLLPTLLLVGISTTLSMVIGIWMGIRSGWRRGSAFDRFSMFSSLVLYSMPEFWLGMLLLLLFSTALGWFPVGGRISTNVSELDTLGYLADVANHLFLPVLTLTLGYLGEFYLLMRSSLLDVLGEDYITTARAKGVLGYVIGGAITVEVVFSYQGLGLLTYTAIVGKDYWLLQGLFLFFSVAVITFNLVADLVYAYLDPRVREA